MAIKRITTNLIKDSDIATVDIANNAITAAKITDGNITTAKLADLSVTAGKLAGTLDLTGKTITVATATTGDNDTSPASTAFVQQEIAALVDSSPDSLNTLNELAAALGDDASFSTTVTNSIATKLPLAGGTLTGDLKIVNSSGATLDINSNASAADSKILLHEGTSASPANGASIRYDGANNLFKIGVGSSVDTTRLTIARDTGNVGIGTTSPQDTLHVVTDSATTNAVVDVARIEATSSGTPAVGFGPVIEFRAERAAASSDSLGRVGFVSDVMTSTRVDGAFIVQTAIDGSFSERMRITSDGTLLLGQTTANANAAVFELTGKNSTQGTIRITPDSNKGSEVSHIHYGSTGDWYIRSASTSGKVVINDAGGNVGIGTSSPTAKLDVRGSVNSEHAVFTGGTNSTRGLSIQTTASGGQQDCGVIFDAQDTEAGQNPFIQLKAAGTGIAKFSNGSTDKYSTSIGGLGGNGANLALDGDDSEIKMANNIIHSDNSGNTKFTIRTAYANTTNLAELSLDGGHITFNSGTAFTEYMRLDGGGHLIVGSNNSTTEAGKLSVYTDATNDPAIYGYRSTSEFKIVPFLSNGAFSSLSSVNDSGLFFSDNFVIAKHSSGDYGMKVFGNGNVAFGTGTAQSKYTFQGDSTSDIITVKSGNNTNSNVGMILFRDSGNTFCGQITANGSTHTTSYNTSSDYRLKENVTYDFNALDRIAQLKPARFNWISDETNTLVDGFLAHEVSDIVPEAIEGEKDATKEEEYEVTPARYEDDGETLISEAVMGTRTVPVYQGIDQSKLVPLLTKAIQELNTKLTAAEARITELEG